MMRCDEAQSRLLESVHAPESVSGALKEHLRGCGECASFHDALGRLDSALGAHLTPARLSESFYVAARRKALQGPATDGLIGAAEAFNWIGAMALAAALGICVGLDFGAPGAIRWGALAVFLTLAAYPSWLLSLYDRGAASTSTD